MRIKIDPKAATNYHSRCYDGARKANTERKTEALRAGRRAWHQDEACYHDRFRVARLEKMAAQWFEVQSEHPEHFITVPIDGIDDLGVLISKLDVCETIGVV